MQISLHINSLAADWHIISDLAFQQLKEFTIIITYYRD